MFPAPSTAGASSPSTEIAWRPHRRSATLPVPVSATPSSTPGLAAEVRLGQVGPAPLAARQTLDRDVAVLVVQRGQQPRQREQRVRRGTAELPAVQRVLQRPHGHGELAVAAQGLAQRRLAEAPVAAVGDHHHVGAHQLRVGVDHLQEVLAAVLLGALDQHLHAHGRLEAERPQRGEVADDPRLVVGRAAAVQAPVAHDRGERIPVGSRPAGRRSARRAGRSCRRCRYSA